MFAQPWQAALKQGYPRIEMALVRRAIEALDGFAPDPDTPIPQMTVEQAIRVLDRHRAAVEGGPRSKRSWTRPRTLDEVRESILRKLEAIEVARRAKAAAAPGLVLLAGPGEDAHGRPGEQA